jgi:hypothetical protein
VALAKQHACQAELAIEVIGREGNALLVQVSGTVELLLEFERVRQREA